jgi:hypothetical protein
VALHAQDLARYNHGALVKVQILTEAKEALMTTVNKEELHFRAFSQLGPNETLASWTS